MAKYTTVETWASRLGFIVERSNDGYVWHSSDDSSLNFCDNAGEVVEKIIQRIREEWGGG